MFGFVVFQKWNIILIHYHDINQNITNHRTISWYIVIDVTILECFSLHANIELLNLQRTLL